MLKEKKKKKRKKKKKKKKKKKNSVKLGKTRQHSSEWSAETLDNLKARNSVKLGKNRLGRRLVATMRRPFTDICFPALFFFVHCNLIAPDCFIDDHVCLPSFTASFSCQ